MYTQPQPQGVNSPPRQYYNPGLPPSPPPPQPAQPMVKMEQVQRKIPSYTFRTLNTESGRTQDKYFDTSANSSHQREGSFQLNSYGRMDKAKDLDTTFNPNQLSNGNFSRTYESTVTLRGDGNTDIKQENFPETDTERFFNKYAKGTGEERSSSFYEPSRKESSEVFLYQSAKRQEDTPYSSIPSDNFLYQQNKKEESFPRVSKTNFM